MNTTSDIQKKHDRKVAAWLLVVAATIFCMIILGGATRLTGSGLSMVDWKPVTGVIPPITDADWVAYFEKYQEFPEYQKVNKGMSVDEFKSIFYFEYFHRVLGRLIGMLFLLPCLYFWFTGAIRRNMRPQMIIMFVLGGCQGLLGWYMVKSGLVNDPKVSQYRLTSHLLAAVGIYTYILWVAFGLLRTGTNIEKPLDVEKTRKLFIFSVSLTSLIVFMIMTGGFVAGVHAGLVYNTFPSMNGQYIPDNLYGMTPFWLNWFENVTTIQFNHRMVAYSLIVIVPVFWYCVRQQAATERSRFAVNLLLCMLFIQVGLGIATLLLRVPVLLGVLHQGGAIVLLTIALYITREIHLSKQ